VPMQIFLALFSRGVDDRPVAAVIKSETDWSQFRLLLQCCLRKGWRWRWAGLLAPSALLEYLL